MAYFYYCTETHKIAIIFPDVGKGFKLVTSQLLWLTSWGCEVT